MNHPLRAWLSRSRSWVRRAWHVHPRQAMVITAALFVGTALVGVGVAGLASGTRELTDEQYATQDGGKGKPAPGTSAPGLTDAGTSTTSATSSARTNVTRTTSPEAQRAAMAAVRAAGGWVAQTGEGLALMVTPDKTVARPGEPVNFSAMVKDVDGAVTALRWDFGDGTIVNSDPKSCADPANRASVEGGASDFAAGLTHTYNAPGEYEVKVTASTGARCGADAPFDTVVAMGKVVVEGERAANGASNPTAVLRITSNTPEDPVLGVSVASGDSDGYVTSVVVDWDDGSGPTMFNFPLSACANVGGQPSSSHTNLAEHTYALSGSYDVTATVTSTGCDGSQSQQAIDVINSVNVGGIGAADIESTVTSLLDRR